MARITLPDRDYEPCGVKLHVRDLWRFTVHELGGGDDGRRILIFGGSGSPVDAQKL